jgi:hypothetical protein
MSSEISQNFSNSYSSHPKKISLYPIPAYVILHIIQSTVTRHTSLNFSSYCLVIKQFVPRNCSGKQIFSSLSLSTPPPFPSLRHYTNVRFQWPINRWKDNKHKRQTLKRGLYVSSLPSRPDKKMEQTASNPLTPFSDSWKSLPPSPNSLNPLPPSHKTLNQIPHSPSKDLPFKGSSKNPISKGSSKVPTSEGFAKDLPVKRSSKDPTSQESSKDPTFKGSSSSSRPSSPESSPPMSVVSTRLARL